MIGVFDSGIGGLTVLKEIYNQIPDTKTIYFGDTARTPYGNKGEDLIKRYSFEIAQFLIKEGADIIVIACNTASAIASDFLRQNFSVPVFEVVTPGAYEAVKISNNKKIAVLGTRATIESGIYNKLIIKKDSRAKVFSKATPLFVPLVEENWIDKPETKEIIKRYLNSINSDFDTLILACTHYGFLKNLLKNELKDVQIVDPGKEVATSLKKFLNNNKKLKNKCSGKKHKFLVSDKTKNFQKLACSWLNKDIQLTKHRFL